MSCNGFNIQRSVADTSDTVACLRAGRDDAGLTLVTADNLTHEQLHATRSSLSMHSKMSLVLFIERTQLDMLIAMASTAPEHFPGMPSLTDGWYLS